MISICINQVALKLSSKSFFRLHKSHVINLREVMVYKKGRGGQVIMSDHTILPVAQRRKSAFLKAWYSKGIE